MFFAFALITGILLIGLLALVRLSAREWIVVPSRSPVWVVLSATLLMLAGCGSGSVTTPPPMTPISTSDTGAATPTSTSASTQGDWTMYHNDNARTGYIENFPDPKQLSRLWDKTLDGAVYAEPLVVGGHVLIATEQNTIYSFDAHTGQEQWHTNVGTPVPRSALPCGNIDPSGITGTPIYDPATKELFAVAEISGPSHILVGLDVSNGQVKLRRQIDVAGMDPTVHQERAALALNQDTVYIAFGGRAGDCGNYHGMVIGSKTNGQGQLLVYQLPTPREGGIWSPPGPAIDNNGRLYVAVGNGEVTSGAWDHTDSVLRLSPTLQLEDGFAPTQWAQDNATDADLGSMSPVLLPNGLVFSAGKSGRAYLLHANALGGVGGQIQEQQVCPPYGGYATVGSQIFLPCSNGIHQVKIEGNSITMGWQRNQPNGSPVVGGHTLYCLDYAGGTLYALNSDDGSVRTSLSIGSTSRFATPTLWNGLVFVGTMQGVVALKVA